MGKLRPQVETAQKGGTRAPNPNGRARKTRQSRKRLVLYVVIGAALIAAVWVATLRTIAAEREQMLALSAQNASNLSVFFERQTLQIIRYCDSYLRAARSASTRKLNAIF